jgi:hypothetical protein
VRPTALSSPSRVVGSTPTLYGWGLHSRVYIYDSVVRR